ncbi:hypothetical protein PHYBOEH_001770 [Phytophthora boehmeriae]|uniref:Uncharacterized protein n=1 Tax=Phytophthora boehmeriae TaxID=109152 RepID=A0A8T1X7N3_9STRA|nr:hypothetical protein PHYBOEH_001770 [Phytophthora boehmeriae]
MHRRRRSTKNVQTTRFSLLLLDDGEYFLDDHSACRYLEATAATHRKVPGRIKVCTRGLFFVPQDLQLPILRFPFRCMAAEPMAECFVDLSTTSDGYGGEVSEAPVVYLTFQTQQVIEMRERGIDHPYVYKDTTEGVEITDAKGSRSSSNSSLNGDMPAKYIFTLQHSKLETFLASIHTIYEVANLPRRMMTKAEEENLLAHVLAPRLLQEFDLSLLVDFRERPLLETSQPADRIEPLLKFPGSLMLTTLRLYFQPAKLNNVLDPVLNWEYTKVDQIYRRRYLLQQIGMEVCMKNGESFFFSFRSCKERDDFYTLMVGQPELQRCRRKDLQFMMHKWQRRELSNFDYLSFLNTASGRTRNDLTQYPVFPWILSDYTSTELNLQDAKVYRDLSKPVGALNTERLEYFKARYEMMPRGDEAEGMPPPFLYGTHYSTPGYVLYFLVRKVPECMLCLQSGKFDDPDRLFRSVKLSWDGCISNPTDLKELIPEFFDCSVPAESWLRNSKHLDLGTTQNFDRVDDVELPPWAHGDATEFVRKNRAALESDYVSDRLHHWIDLIFGYKQRGEEAIKANNLDFALSCCDVSPNEKLVFVGCWDNRVRMYSAGTGLVVDKLIAHSDGISAIRVLQDRFFTSSWDSTIKLWRYTSRFIVATPIRTFLDCEESVLCLDVSRDGQFGAAGTRNGFVYLFDLSAAVLRNQVDASASRGGGISSISFAADNKSYICVTMQNELFHFNLKGEKLWDMDVTTAGQIRCFDSDGKYAVGGSTAGKILFWKLHEEAGKELVHEIPQAHDASISALAVGCTGSILVSGDVDGSIHIWKLLEKKTFLHRKQVPLSSSRKSPPLSGSIQTTSSESSSSSSKRRSKRRHKTKAFIPNSTAQFAEAECCIEF